MTNHHDLVFQYALTQIAGLSLGKQNALFAQYGNAESVFKAPASELKNLGLKENVVAALKQSQDFAFAETALASFRSQGIQILSCADSHYPKRLREISAHPLLLYYKGDLAICNHSLTLAVVGSRDITPYGERVLKNFIPELVAAGFVIVSGMAFGVDALAHRLCLQAAGSTIGVQAQGADQGYPRAHQKLYEDVSTQGLLFSEYPCAPKYTGPELFPQRNRLLSGLSDGILVIEAKEKSGSLITAYFGVEQNRNVYAVPGNLEQVQSRGCLAIIKQGAKCVLSARDVIEDFTTFNFASKKSGVENLESKKVMRDDFESPLERKIFEFCHATPRTIDEIVESTAEMPAQVMAILTKMELVGKLCDVGGKRFHGVN